MATQSKHKHNPSTRRDELGFLDWDLIGQSISKAWKKGHITKPHATSICEARPEMPSGGDVVKVKPIAATRWGWMAGRWSAIRPVTELNCELVRTKLWLWIKTASEGLWPRHFDRIALEGNLIDPASCKINSLGFLVAMFPKMTRSAVCSRVLIAPKGYLLLMRGIFQDLSE